MKNTQQAEVLLAQGDFTGAIRFWMAELRENPQCRPAYYGIGWALFHLKEYKPALEILSSALRQFPDDAMVHALLHLLFLQQGMHQQAQGIVQSWLSAHPLDEQLTGLITRLQSLPDAAVMQLFNAVPLATPVTTPQLDLAGLEASYRNLSFSQEGEDLVLARLFGDQQGGIYVDVGAHHPYRFSNTHLFYLKGWQGINIEPNPDVAALFNTARPRDINLCCGVAGQTGHLSFYKFNEPALNTFDTQVVKRRTEQGFSVIQQIDVDIQPLSVILQKYIPAGLTIDFLSVDVEGFDFEVLQSNDWNQYRPRCVVAELLDCDVIEALNSELVSFMISKGYRFFSKTFHSTIFIEQNFVIV